jgi:hypothetical protein
MKRHLIREKEYADFQRIPAKIRQENGGQTRENDFQFFDENSQKTAFLHDSDEIKNLLFDLARLNMQEFYIFQQKFFNPNISLTKIGQALGVSAPAICKRLRSIRKKSNTIYEFITRDKRYDINAEIARNRDYKKDCEYKQLTLNILGTPEGVG